MAWDQPKSDAGSAELLPDERARILAALREKDWPAQIGPFRIVELLGRGGMGIVLLGEQAQPIQRKVAIKLVKLGFDTREVVARFQGERQVLALLEHPNIAKVLEAGITTDGRPYFVMEYVPGEPITSFADRHKLILSQRLILFRQVCDAIAHAHSKAILHRDIKASNVLAYIRDDKPVAKVIDFGIAKALSGDRPAGLSMHTELGQIVGTFEYMSPEQAQGSADIDTQSDIYSLGVLLYELLTGMPPFSRQMLAHATDEELRRIIREVDPPRPSAQLSETGPATTRIATDRQTHVDRLARQLRNELEWIPLKAMRKERQRRYASVQQLSQDIDNFLSQRPLLAGPETRSYRARKWLRRYRAPVTATVAAGIVLLGVSAAYVVGIQREQARTEAALLEARHQKTLAEQRFNDVRALANTFLFDVHELIKDLPGATPARKLLVSTALEYLNKLSAQAGEDRALLREIAVAYLRVGDVQGSPRNQHLGDTQGALDSYRKSLNIFQSLVDANRTNVAAQKDLAVGQDKFGELLAVTGDSQRAMEIYLKVLKLRQNLAEREPTNVIVQQNLAGSHAKIAGLLAASGDLRGALEGLRTAMRIRQLLADADPTNPRKKQELANLHTEIGDMLAQSGDMPAAMESQRKSLEIRQQLAAADPTSLNAQRDLSISREKIGDLLLVSGDTNTARQMFDEILPMRQKLADADASNAMAQRDLEIIHSKIGNAKLASGDPAAALESYRASLSIRQSRADADPSNANAQRDLLYSLGKMGDALSAMGADATQTIDRRIEFWRSAREWYVRQTDHYAKLKERGLLLPRQTKSADSIMGARHGATARSLNCWGRQRDRRFPPSRIHPKAGSRKMMATIFVIAGPHAATCCMQRLAAAGRAGDRNPMQPRAAWVAPHSSQSPTPKHLEAIARDDRDTTR